MYSPPHSEEAEKGFLGFLINNPTERLSLLELIQPSYFFRPSRATIYKAMRSLHGMNPGFGMADLCDHLKQNGILEEVGGKSAILDMGNVDALSSERFAGVQYAESLISFYILRNEEQTILQCLSERKPEVSIEAGGAYRNTPLGWSCLFADVFQGIARFAPERGCWFVYDGRRWTYDQSGVIVAGLCQALANALLIYYANLQDRQRPIGLLQGWQSWQRVHVRRGIIDDARGRCIVSMVDFDSDPLLFNVLNGTLDLRTGVLHKHNPGNLITRLAPVTFDSKVVFDRWNRFISEITEDSDKAAFLQRAFGYALSGDVSFECLFILYGSSTRNGKGTLTEAVLSVLGNYGASTNPESLSLNRRTDGNTKASEDIARLAGIRFSSISEPGKSLVFDAARLKSYTGGDRINARFLGENSFDFKPSAKFYINTNHLPTVKDPTLFTSGRICVIPFERHFSESEQDRSLKAQFQTPEAQSAILNWLIAGWLDLQEQGLNPPQCVIDAVNDYQSDSDDFARFIDERLMKDSSSEVRSSSVYQTYLDWCDGVGIRPEKQTGFKASLSRFGQVVRKRPKDGGNTTTFLLGFRLPFTGGDCIE